ncbi:MAG: SapC family protein [Pseudomonadota bacterium]|nr:SapC family protein [Pseudomonadota bacterium]
MATQAPNNLPLLYRGLEPLNRQAHGDKRVRRIETIPAVSEAHAVPVTVDEFMLAGRFFPIIFSSGEQPVPLALMGLHEGANTFFDTSGKLIDANVYVPAYLRRYPFVLARLTETTDQLSLCFDPESGAVGDFDDGDALFDGDDPSQATNEILAFCEQFEQAGQRTGAFMADLQALGLLMDGEVAISPEGSEQPFIYRGFQMIDEAKFRELRGDELRKMNQNGSLGLVMAHLFSLALVRDIFARHVKQGSGPTGYDPLGTGNAAALGDGGAISDPAKA